jgi:hypothetical protein
MLLIFLRHINLKRKLVKLEKPEIKWCLIKHQNKQRLLTPYTKLNQLIYTCMQVQSQQGQTPWLTPPKVCIQHIS